MRGYNFGNVTGSIFTLKNKTMKNLMTKKEAKKLLWLFGRHDGGALYCSNFFNGEHITFSAFSLKTLRKKITKFYNYKN